MRLLLWSLSIMVVRSGGQRYYGGCGGPTGSGPVCGTNCTNVKPAIQRALSEVYLDGELFVNLYPFSDVGLQFDNICVTVFPTVGFKNNYIFYISTVFTNGTNIIQSFMVNQNTLGAFNVVSPACSTITDTIIGTDQCGSFLAYRCYPCEGCPDRDEIDFAPVYGVSRKYQQMSPSCFQQAAQVIQANGVPPQRYIRLPMRLPSRCVTRQPCAIYPTSGSSQCTS